MNTIQVAVIEGDDASPEAVQPVVALLASLLPEIDWVYPEVGDAAMDAHGTPLPQAAIDLIDASDTTLFGSTSTSSARALFYLRWGKQTYANVRPTRYLPGYQSALANPEGVDFIVVRENLEDLYLGIEGDVAELSGMPWRNRTGQALAEGGGRYALKVITEEGSRRVVTKAFELARERRGKVTCATKHNMLPKSDGLFREVAIEVAASFPDVTFESFIVDDFAHRLCRDPHAFDVTVMPNLYGDIMSDAAAGLVGGLGMAASGCYGDDYAYFESAHGTAPDIAGQHIINPTATLLSACMMLRYVDRADMAAQIEAAVADAYVERDHLTPDQGGDARTDDFVTALGRRLGV